MIEATGPLEWNAVRFKSGPCDPENLAQLPAGTTWGQVYGVAVLCGVGFTMSLFIGSLAFEHGNFDLLAGVKIGVLIASLLSAAWGLLVLHFVLPKRKIQGNSVIPADAGIQSAID